MKYIWLIPFGIFALILFVRLILPRIIKVLYERATEKGNICSQCKGGMDTVYEGTFLIPVTLDHTYECSAEYYAKNCVPIAGESQIPTGNRACRILLLKCRACGEEVGVIDYLKVREYEVVKNANVYPLERFGDFFEKLPDFASKKRINYTAEIQEKYNDLV